MKIYKVKGIKEEDSQKYECGSYILIAHKKSCEFCQHLTDTFWDFTNGPYMYFCDKGVNVTNDILKYGCNDFEEENKNENL